MSGHLAYHIRVGIQGINVLSTIVNTNLKLRFQNIFGI